MNEPWIGLFDLGLFWGWFKSGKDKPDPEPTAAIINGFVSWVRNRALEHQRSILFADADTLFKQTIPGAENYKRREHDADGLAALQEATRILEIDHHLPVWRSPGLEADDGLAAHAIAAANMGWMVRVFAEDKDLLTLTTHERIVVYRRPPGTDKMRRRDCVAADVIAHFGVSPYRLPEYLAFVDKVDGIPGVAGIGKVGALALMKAFEPVTKALEIGDGGLPAPGVDSRIRKALAGNEKNLLLALRLTMFENVPAQDIRREWLEFPKVEPMGEVNAGSWDADEMAVETRPETAPSGEHALVQEQVKVQQEPTSLLDEVTAATEQKIAAGDWIRSFDRSLEPTSLPAAWKLAETLSGAMIYNPREKRLVNMYAKVGNTAAIFAVILKGRELDLPAMLSLAHIKIVEGKAEADAALMVALAVRSGRVKYVRCTETTDERATYETLHASLGATPQRLTWDLDRARKAGLFPAKDAFSPWGKYTRVMLRWRAASELLRMVCPEAIAGLYVRGELDDALTDEDVERGRVADARVPT